MTVWTWILVGVGGFFVVSLFVGLAIATILNNSGRQLSELMELEAWTSSPLTRTSDEETVIAGARSQAGRSTLV
jgi:hypothetical protein